MISSCPHCQKPLKLGDAQQEKIKQAIAGLAPGKKLTIKCPACQQAIGLDASSLSTGQAPAGGIKPPDPPDMSWLKDAKLEDEDRLEDVPMALVLHPKNDRREIITDALENVGYQVILAKDIDDARERMRFVNFACVAMHSRYEADSLAESTFHKFMREMPMQRRRYLFYMIIGPEFNTLYNLQALAYSANLVVNEDDLYHLDVALRKAIPLYEELFGAYMEELTSAGKS